MQYRLYLKGVVTFDFGKTFSGRPVVEQMAHAFPITIRLAFMAIAIEAIFGILLGVIAGMRKGKWFDSTILVFSMVLISVPTFVIGFLLQYFVGVKWGLLPTTVGANVSFKSLLMPAIVLSAVSLAYIIRLTRQSI